MADDGINRIGLDYRAGWCEALRNLGQRLQIAGLRATKKTAPGLEEASQLAAQMYKEMIDKMKSGSTEE